MSEDSEPLSDLPETLVGDTMVKPGGTTSFSS